MKVMIINGPNLNLLGKREKSIYGDISFEDYLKDLQAQFTNMNIEYFQSNIEGELIDKLQEVGFSYDYILLNAGGYTHTSVALTDTVAAIEMTHSLELFTHVSTGGGASLKLLSGEKLNLTKSWELYSNE